MLLRAQFNHYCEVVGRASACGAFVTTVQADSSDAGAFEISRGAALLRRSRLRPARRRRKRTPAPALSLAEYGKEVLISNQTRCFPPSPAAP